MSAFTHLHVHTQYSLLEGAIKIPELTERLKALGQEACAITDHGNMFGAVDFYFAAKNAGLKPIIGTELFYTTGTRFNKGPVKGKKVVLTSEEEEALRNYRLVLLCKNAEGYRNLCEIVTRGYTEGFRFRPRADRELIARYSSGLVALTAGLKGEIAFHSAHGRAERAEEALKWLQGVFKDDLYLEVQENGIPAQGQANAMITDMAERYGVPVVATAQAHYLTKEDGVAQEVLMCIGAGRNIDEARSTRLNTDEFWLKDTETMRKQFHWHPEAVSNTQLVAAKCEFHFKVKDDKGRPIYHLPAYRPDQWVGTHQEAATPAAGLNQTTQESDSATLPKHTLEQIELAKANAGLAMPDGKFSAEGFLRVLARKGLTERLAVIEAEAPLESEKRKAYTDRLEAELDMIVKTGFAGYFLVVADFINYAKSIDVPVGPGRGSGAGSIVAYALKITDIDPIPFNLLFERFINPERISMPDFDVDFCQDRRQEVIEYVIRKYGRDNVSQIITFGKLNARSVIRDVARVQNFTHADADQIAKLVPEELKITLEDALEKEPRLKNLTETDPRVGKLFEIAMQLEGLSRNAGIHAAGVVITNNPLVEYCPLFTGKEGESVVQYDKDFAEKIGLVKFDFLGLKTLTVIDNAVRFVRETQTSQGVPADRQFRLEQMKYDDPTVYKLISDGDTDGVFQLESSGMKDLCMRVQPSNLEDITAINALYRPGPLNSGMVDDYINRKHGKTPVVYDLPQLADILAETYGVIVYQEQVMRIARVLANYSLGEADILRRAMGKKKAEEMAAQRTKFLKGCEVNQIAADKANKIFDLLAMFAEYGFNKSHSAAYGVLSYQTAYLKAYYPAQFMAALMATEMNDTDKMAHYISDARRRGIEILPPDVNQSRKTFSVVVSGEKNSIRFGLEAIKGVGGVAVDAIIAEREAKGPFQGFADFCKRVSLRKVNKKVVECLISTGAFDAIAEENRATLFESIEAVMDFASKDQEAQDLGQVSMFDAYQAEGLKLDTQTGHLFKKIEDWSESKKLQSEKQLVGFYVSGHPIDKYWPLAKDFVHGDIAWIKSEFERRKKLPVKERGSAPAKSQGFGPGSYRDQGPKWDVVTAAVVSSIKEIITKSKGERMAFVEFEDAKTKIEGVCFPRSYEQLGPIFRQSMEQCMPFLVSATIKLDDTEEAAKLLINAMDSITDYQAKRVNSVLFRLDPSKVDAHKLAQLRAILVAHRGKCSAFLEYTGSVGGTSFQSRHQLPRELAVNPTPDMVSEVNKLFGGDVVKFVHFAGNG